MKRSQFLTALIALPFIPLVLKDNSPEWSAWRLFKNGRYRLKGKVVEVRMYTPEWIDLVGMDKIIEEQQKAFEALEPHPKIFLTRQFNME